MKKIIAIVALVMALGLATKTQAQKFGYVSSETVIYRMPEYAKMEQDVNEKGKALQANKVQLEQDFQEKQDLFIKDSSKMDEAKKKYKLTELQELYTKLSQFDQTAQQEMQEFQEKLMEPISIKFSTEIKAIAKEKAYTYIFDASKGGLLYAPPADDLMPILEKRLNLRALPKNPNEAAPTAAGTENPAPKPIAPAPKKG